MSLRGRLLVGLVLLVAAGLAVAAFATYTAQRAFLYNRVDQQVVSVAAQVGTGGGPGFGGGGQGAAPPAGLFGPGAGTGTSHGGPYGGDPDGNGGPGHPAPPSNTIIEHVNAAGKPLSRSLLFGSTEVYPALPAHFPISTSTAHPRLFDTGATGGSSERFRALALRPAGATYTTVFAVPLTDVQQTLDRLLLVEALVAAGVLLALVVLGSVVIRIGLRPLERMGRVADEIAGGDLSRRVTPATPRTEVGRLGLALNSMLVTIEQAFADRRESEDRLRRFLSDASHELRTPLASIRGYAELFRLGAASDPEDLAKAMERIESEAARMGVLVEELLMLARLDELPETRHEPVQLAEIAERAAADARAVAPDRAIEVGGSVPPVAGDPDQLHQVLANLLRNAIAHTPAGTPIEVGLAREQDRAVLTVRDHGPGLPDGVADRIFERFWRSDPGRSRGRGGAGLGLAIVQAIVQGHEGEVHAANAPDGGAVFRVLLPLATGDAAPSPATAGDEGSQPSLRGASG